MSDLRFAALTATDWSAHRNFRVLESLLQSFIRTESGFRMVRSFLELDHISAPAAPATGSLRLYAKDIAGATGLFMKDGAGTETRLDQDAQAQRGCTVFRNSDLGVVNGVATAVPWNAEEFDTDGFHDTATNPSRLTVPIGLGGKYLLTWGVRLKTAAANKDQILNAYIVKNGSPLGYGLLQRPIRTGDPELRFSLTGSLLLDLSAGDYVEVFVEMSTTLPIPTFDVLAQSFASFVRGL